jgi:hypothetical protein
MHYVTLTRICWRVMGENFEPDHRRCARRPKAIPLANAADHGPLLAVRRLPDHRQLGLDGSPLRQGVRLYNFLIIHNL